MDHHQIAEMSCIAGVGGNVKSLVKVAQSSREIIALDGCGLQCVIDTLTKRGVTPDQHFILSDMGAKKRYHKNYTADEKEKVTSKILEQISVLSVIGCLTVAFRMRLYRRHLFEAICFSTLH